MTEEDRKVLTNLANKINEEVHKMTTTNRLTELDTMALYAKRNIDKLMSMKFEIMQAEWTDREKLLEEVRNS